MRDRFVGLVCVLALVALPLGAQTLSLSNAWSQTVTGQAQNITNNTPPQKQTLNPNGSWNTGMPASGDVEEKLAFMQGSTYLANTPITVSGVTMAQLVYNPTYNVLTVKLTPVASAKKNEHDIEEANAFLATKLPSKKEFCLEVMRLAHDRLRLANGMIVAAAGDLKLLPKEGKSGCVCGRGLEPAHGSNMERFEVMQACVTKK